MWRIDGFVGLKSSSGHGVEPFPRTEMLGDVLQLPEASTTHKKWASDNSSNMAILFCMPIEGGEGGMTVYLMPIHAATLGLHKVTGAYATAPCRRVGGQLYSTKSTMQIMWKFVSVAKLSPLLLSAIQNPYPSIPEGLASIPHLITI